MSDQKFDCEKIKEHGWRQGACLAVDRSNVHDKNGIQLTVGLYIVISQDCDIVNHDINKEPYVELLLINEVVKENGSLMHGKNPRKIHLTITIDGKQKFLECSVHDRFFMPRGELTNVNPSKDYLIEDENLVLLVRWLANRYVRSAFPDVFNQRVGEVAGEVRSILKQEGGLTYGVFVRLNTREELDKGKPYKLILALLHHPKYTDDFSSEFAGCLDKISKKLSAVAGIEVVQEQVLSIDQITHFDYLKYQRWDFDYLSQVDGADGEVL